MANIKIAPVLKKYRKQNDLSVHEVSKKLKERSLNVAEKLFTDGKADRRNLMLTHL